MEMGRDGTAEPVSRDQILRREWGLFFFPVQLTTSRIGNLTRLIHTLVTYIYTDWVGQETKIVLDDHNLLCCITLYCYS